MLFLQNVVTGAFSSGNLFPHTEICMEFLQVVIKDKVLELLLYFTKHEDEEVKTKAIIGLGKNTIFSIWYSF